MAAIEVEVTCKEPPFATVKKPLPVLDRVKGIAVAGETTLPNWSSSETVTASLPVALATTGVAAERPMLRAAPGVTVTWAVPGVNVPLDAVIVTDSAVVSPK